MPRSTTINYASVNSPGGFWEFSSTSYEVGSTTHSLSGSTGIADTGTTLILMGDPAVGAYYASVKGAFYSWRQGGYIFPCSAAPLTLFFGIGTSPYATIPPALMIFG